MFADTDIANRTQANGFHSFHARFTTCGRLPMARAIAVRLALLVSYSCAQFWSVHHVTACIRLQERVSDLYSFVAELPLLALQPTT